MRATILGAVLLGAGGIFASVLLVRRSVTEAESPRSAGERPSSIRVREDLREKSDGQAVALPRPEPERLAAVRPAPAVRIPIEEFWEGLGATLETRSSVDPDRYRQELMAKTADYLGLDPSRAIVFRSVAVQAVAAIQIAWKSRDEEVLSLPAFLGDEERDRREQEIQERYEAVKRQASDQLESLLGTTERHERFRQRLGEWIDAIR